MWLTSKTLKLFEHYFCCNLNMADTQKQAIADQFKEINLKDDKKKSKFDEPELVNIKSTFSYNYI